jgi:Bacteriophage head to tail connecting protein
MAAPFAPAAPNNVVAGPWRPHGQASLRGAEVQKLVRHGESRMIAERTLRYTWWVHWREVAEYILPRRYRWLVTPNELNRGVPLNQHIINNSGTKSAQNCAAGLKEGTTSSGRPWFKLTIPDMDVADTSPVKLWLDEVEKRILRILAGSNYYSAKATQYFDLVVFGTAPMLIYEDDADVIRCTNPCAGEYFVWNDDTLRIGGIAREFTMSVEQLVRKFKLANCSDSVQRLFATGGASLSKEVRVCHMIEANDNRVGGTVLPSRFKFREFYWEGGNSALGLLQLQGYIESPFSCPRWDLAANDAYGRSPGMDALGSVKQLQLMERRAAQGVDKQVNPPLKAHVSMKNQPAVNLPGGVTYVTDMSAAGSGIAPVYEVKPDLEAMGVSMQNVEKRIDETFFGDLWAAISNLDRDVTAFQVARIQEEKLVRLGPVLERNQNESLDPDLDRVFAIASRRGMLPPAPKEIHGYPLQVQYVSMMAVAQRAASTSALEQLVKFAGALQAGDIATAQAGPNATTWDNINRDELLDEYADMLGVSPRVIEATVMVAKIRQQRQQAAAKAQQAQQNMAMLAQASNSAKELGSVDVGGGQNAVQAMLGAAGGGQGQPMQQAA